MRGAIASLNVYVIESPAPMRPFVPPVALAAETIAGVGADVSTVNVTVAEPVLPALSACVTRAVEVPCAGAVVSVFVHAAPLRAAVRVCTTVPVAAVPE
jgi:hypothetical protein